MGMVRLGSGVHSWALRAFPLFMLSCLQIVRNGNCERGCEGKLISKKSSLSGYKWVPSHNRARLHNNYKGEYLILERKVTSIITYVTICPNYLVINMIVLYEIMYNFIGGLWFQNYDDWHFVNWSYILTHYIETWVLPFGFANMCLKLHLSPFLFLFIFCMSHFSMRFQLLVTMFNSNIWNC